MDDRSRYTSFEDELPLSGAALEGLMRAVLSRGLPFRFRALGCSMIPFIQDGDLVCVSPLSGHAPKVGDVVAFIDPRTRRITVHRIVCSAPHAYFPKGDNQSDQGDGAITLEDILGWVTHIERDGRTRRLGLGPEKSLIAALSRRGWLQPYLNHLAPLLRPLRKVLS